MNKDTLCFLDKVRSKGDLLGLESVRGLMNEMGNPQNDLKVIQVAGTNGKGSTIAFLSAILQEAGLRVGVYTSPEVFFYEERFRINDSFITSEEYDRIILKIKDAYGSLERKKAPLPTIFEVETAVAVLFFADCDIAIFEAGMGGDLDATNIFDSPLMAVFTSIGMDHMQYLGSTIEEIASHKAGIIKSGEMVVCTPQENSVCNILKQVAADNKASIHFSNGKETEGYKLTLRGLYQRTNSALAVACANELIKKGYDIKERHIADGLKKAKWHGRFERLETETEFEIWLDGAHNPPAALALREAIEAEFSNKSITMIIGMLKDKDYESVLSILAPLADNIITITPKNDRGLSAEELAKTAVCYCNGKVSSAGEYHLAAEQAATKNSDVILITGSLSILRDMRQAFMDYLQNI